MTYYDTKLMFYNDRRLSYKIKTKLVSKITKEEYRQLVRKTHKTHSILRLTLKDAIKYGHNHYVTMAVENYSGRILGWGMLHGQDDSPYTDIKHDIPFCTNMKHVDPNKFYEYSLQLYVSRKYRRKGIGSKIYHTLSNMCKNKPVDISLFLHDYTSKSFFKNVTGIEYPDTISYWK